MTKQGINTEAVAAAADRLRQASNNIASEFCTLQNRVGRLEDGWRGAAGTVAQTTIHQLLSHNEVREQVLQNYLDLLEKQINPGYQNAEMVNTSLADKFR